MHGNFAHILIILFMEAVFVLLTEQIHLHSNRTTSQPISSFEAKMEHFGNLLSWLKAQDSNVVSYPHYYFHFRDEPRCLAAIGKVRSFSDEICAQQFISEQDLSLIGGLTFDCEGQFWLPRLLIEQTEKDTTIRVYIDNQADLTREKLAALEVIKSLEHFTALLPVQQSIRLLQRKAEQSVWCDWVAQSVQCIEKGEFNKVVLANESHFESDSPINAYDFLDASKQKNTGCYHFLYAEHADQIFVGSTPERLYQRRSTQLKTEALAGTAPMSEDTEYNYMQGIWLLNDVKNDAENKLVVKNICDNLKDCVKQIRVSDVGLKQLRRVQHLCRQIEAELKPNYQDATCLRAIHPTAAISGLPQQSAVKFLKNIENFDRSWYAGTLGVMSRQQAEFCVTIRSAFIEQNRIRIFAGAGIVAGSVPLLEWNEIERKASGLLSLLGEQSCP